MTDKCFSLNFKVLLEIKSTLLKSDNVLFVIERFVLVNIIDLLALLKNEVLIFLLFIVVIIPISSFGLFLLFIFEYISKL